VGSGNYITYKKTRDGNSRIDNVVIETLKETKKDFQIREFYPFGSDERQFCSPGINLPVGVLMRTPYYEYKEYHTADDNLKFIKKKHLNDSLITLCKIISKLENEKISEKPKNKKIIKLKHDTYLNLKPNCEPQLGRRKLFTMKGAAFGTDKNESENIRQLAIFWLLNFSDGVHSLRDIAKKSDLSLPLLKKSAKRLVEKKLLKKLA
jgi:aminopeptidase-like protein